MWSYKGIKQRLKNCPIESLRVRLYEVFVIIHFFDRIPIFLALDKYYFLRLEYTGNTKAHFKKNMATYTKLS